MNQEIKKRIEEINNGIVPEGYKQTPFGIFPCDWETKYLDDICVMQGGGTPDTKNQYYWEGDIPWISSSDLNEDDFYNVNITRYITQDAVKKSATKICPSNSIAVVTRVGVGKIALIDRQYCTSQDFTNIIDTKCYTLYLLYQLKSAINRKLKECQGTSIKGITTKELQKLQIDIPKKEIEQSKIAEILMKWDEMVELQEQYIQKLELRKKAIMKKLLTPTKGWENKKLGDVCKIKTGKLDANAMVENGEYPFFTCSKEIFTIDKYSFDCEALLMAGNGDIGDIKYYNGKFDAYQRTYVLSDFSFNIKYAMYYLLFNFDKDVMKGMQKSSMPYIKLELLQKADIFYDENTVNKTVEMLEKVDEEISLQKEKLEKIKIQRKAMQQYLLTGIVRVV